MAVVRIVHNLWIARPCTFRNAYSQRKRRLQFVHAGLYFMAFDGFPYVSGPVLVELMRILYEQHVVRIDMLRAAVVDADGKRIRLAVPLEYRHDLAAAAWRCLRHDVLDLQRFDRTERPGLLAKINRRTISVVIVAISLAHPHRFEHQLARILRILRM